MHCNLDFGLVMRHLGSKYTAKWRDVDAILAAIDLYVSKDDNENIRRILMKGCPKQNVWEETAKNRETFIC